MDKIKVGIIGATGYAGCELVRLLHTHPQAQVAAESSVSYEGKRLSDVYPSLKNIADMTLLNEDAVIAASDVVFTSLPHGLSEAIARKCVDKGVKIIDLGADFRLSDESDYHQWYGLDYKEKDLHALSAYCIPELHRNRIAGKCIIGNPGCYPTSVALALAPLLTNNLINNDTIVIDSKSGVTGAGRGLTQMSHYPDCNEAFQPYKIAEHRHTPEIEETLSALAGNEVKVTFVPHLLPVNRGIVSTVYANLNTENTDIVYDVYRQFYANEKFVRILERGTVANIKYVKYSNYCDISLHFDNRTGRIIIVSVIDNMVKGAAGQAIQNMNLLFGIDEGTGLDFVPPAF